jgi:hypothetical protein
MPFVAIMSRSEQVMKLCLVAFGVLPMLARALSPRRSTLAMLVAAFLLLSSVLFYSHPKSLFFLPFVLATGVLLAPVGRRRLWSAITLPCVLVMALQCYRLSADVLRCDDSPPVAKFFDSTLLSPGLLFTQPRVFVHTGLDDLVDAPSRAWSEVIFSANNTGWVPLPRSRRLPPAMRDLNEQTRPVFIALFWCTPLLLLLAARRLSAAAREHAALGGALVVGLGAHAFFYKSLPFYNCTLLISALSLVAALAVSVDQRPIVPRALRQTALFALLVVASQNLVALIGHFGPTLRANARLPGPTVPDQPWAIPIFGFDEERTKIRELARSCAIAGDGDARLVIDDYTMHAFEHLREPINLFYVTDVFSLLGKPYRGEKVRPFLRSLGSPGIIGRCSLFPKALKSAAQVSGEYCCVGKDAFEDRPEPP